MFPPRNNAMTLRDQLTEFVEKERGILELNNRIRAGEKLQTVGYHSSITPSVLQRLEWMLRNSVET